MTSIQKIIHEEALAISVQFKKVESQWIEKAANLSQKELEFEVVKINPRPTTKEIIKPVQEDRAELKMGISKKLESNLRKVQDILSQKKKTHVTLEQAMEFITDMFLEHEDPVRKAQRLCSNTVEKKNRDRKVEVSRKAATMGRLAPSLHCSAMSGTTKTKRLPIPANIKHQVVLRDKNQCTHNHHGRRCEMQRWIQLHHIKPVSQGGLNTVANLKTLCFYHHREAHR